MRDGMTVKPLSPMRKAIAARMVEAKRSIPEFRVSADIEMDALIRERADMRKHHGDAALSLNDLLIKACATALVDAPDVNLQWADTEIHQQHDADISIVTAVEGGLSTPIIRKANRKSVWEISREVRELTARAAKNALKMDEVFGGSFTVSNLGMHDVDAFDAIINPPQCAILAVSTAKPRVVVRADRTTHIATVLRVTLSCDHRAIDGVAAARFLSALRARIEQPEHLRSQA